MAPRLNKELREELRSLKGQLSQSEAAEQFGVNVSTVSRLWKDNDVDKFNVEVIQESDREKIQVMTTQNEFLDEVEQKLDEMQSKIQKGPVTESKSNDKELEEFANVDQALDTYSHLLKPENEAPPKRKFEDIGPDSKLMEEVDLFLKTEQEPKKKSRKKRKVEVPVEVSPTVGTMPLVEPPKVVLMPKEMLLTRITIYLENNAALLQSYIGKTENEKNTFLKSLPGKTQEQLQEIYTQFKSLVSFKGQTNVAFSSALGISSAVEHVTARMGFNTLGMTQSLIEEPAYAKELQEICEDHVAENWKLYSKVNRSEVRFASLLFKAGADNVRRNQLEVESPPPDSEDEIKEEGYVSDEEYIPEEPSLFKL